jgi:hypothetical protein
MKPKMNPNEVVIKACESKHYGNNPTRKGKLVLTNQRLFFWPSESEKNLSLLEIWPKDIFELHFFNTLILIPNGINIITKDGNHNMFRVKERSAWSQMINQMY